jgi:hypothetical protein
MASAVDASADVAAVPSDAGGDAVAYPAFPASGMPQVIDNKGAVLSSPTIVTVTWTADPNEAAYDALGDAIGASTYWSATTSEYGIGAATSGTTNHVHITTTPQETMEDTALDTFVGTQVSAAPGNGWPANTAQTVYVIYIPEATELTTNGKNACSVEEGYHDETYTSTVNHIVYAVIVEGCHGTQDVVEFSTETSSHEMVESATDPHVQTDLAWAGFDEDHWAWELWQDKQDELADACEYFPDAYYSEPALFGDWLQRTWSNAMAAGGHNPCVPAAAGPYFNVTPLGVASVSVASGAKTIATKGYFIPVSTTSTIELGLYSDAPMAAWSVAVVEGDGFSTPSTPHLSVVPKQMGGANGDVVDVDITTLSTKESGVLVTAISTATGQPTHYMPLLIATQ